MCFHCARSRVFLPGPRGIDAVGAPGLEGVPAVDDLPAGQAEVAQSVDVVLVQLGAHGSRQGGAARATTGHAKHVAADYFIVSQDERERERASENLEGDLRATLQLYYVAVAVDRRLTRQPASRRRRLTRRVAPARACATREQDPGVGRPSVQDRAGRQQRGMIAGQGGADARAARTHGLDNRGRKY